MIFIYDYVKKRNTSAKLLASSKVLSDQKNEKKPRRQKDDPINKKPQKFESIKIKNSDDDEDHNDGDDDQDLPNNE